MAGDVRVRCHTEEQTRAEFDRLWGARRSAWLKFDQSKMLHGLGEPLAPSRLRGWERRELVTRCEYVEGRGVRYVRGPQA